MGALQGAFRGGRKLPHQIRQGFGSLLLVRLNRGNGKNHVLAFESAINCFSAVLWIVADPSDRLGGKSVSRLDSAAAQKHGRNSYGQTEILSGSPAHHGRGFTCGKLLHTKSPGLYFVPL